MGTEDFSRAGGAEGEALVRETGESTTRTMDQHTLYSPRLVLRPFETGDAAHVQKLAGDSAIADTTLNIPHPYEDGMAESWIDGHDDRLRVGHLVFAIALRASNDLIGAVSLRIDSASRKAELGYWVGVPYWNEGFATEAASRLIEHAFEDLSLNRIAARHFARNPASGRVMEKTGMVHEGTIREGALKGERFEDLELYAILRSDWQAQRSQ